MQALEASYLRDLLDRHGGNISAAKSAGIDRKTFHRLANKYQLRWLTGRGARRRAPGLCGSRRLPRARRLGRSH